MIRSEILPRLVRRYALEGNAVGDASCTRLLGSAPTPVDRKPLLVALDEALRGRKPETVAPVLSCTLETMAEQNRADTTLTRLAARLGSGPARDRVRSVVTDRQAAEAERLVMLEVLGELKDRASAAPLLDLATGVDPASASIQSAALGALGQFGRLTPLPRSCWPLTLIKGRRGAPTRGSCS